MRSSVLSSLYLLASTSSWIDSFLFKGKASLTAALYGDRRHGQNVDAVTARALNHCQCGWLLGYQSVGVFHGPDLQNPLLFQETHFKEHAHLWIPKQGQSFWQSLGLRGRLGAEPRGETLNATVRVCWQPRPNWLVRLYRSRVPSEVLEMAGATAQGNAVLSYT